MSKPRNTEAPLGPRSLIASLLLRSQPPRMPPARLVQWCGLFDVREGAARVALSRMVDRGELVARDGTYELAGRVGARRASQDWSIAPSLAPWNGGWRLAIVTGGARTAAERGALRDAMTKLRMASPREGVWLRPDNLPRTAAPEEAWAIADAQCTWWDAQPEADERALVRELFDATAWAKAAARHAQRLHKATDVLGRGRERDLANAFLAGTAGVAHLRADPLLPAELGDAFEAGATLRDTYAAFEAAFSAALRAWFRSHP